ncbi:hypothetical protein [Oceanicoccus sp. KOV_DT_Chl]|uniref:hypothetical protein n=1 Tax=Oceanicoccus sp. KOV_DT_Chl TaxID=1904639 RepID=UPI000C7DC230|nr:hypothetical protein [Oceanicoccus sp. KOV_DT_Chl]
MKIVSFRILLSMALLLAVGNAFAAMTGASVSPSQRTLSDTGNNIFSVSWTVATDGRTAVNVMSPNASLTRGATPLGTTGSLFSNTGVGPFVFNEIFQSVLV